MISNNPIAIVDALPIYHFEVFSDLVLNSKHQATSLKTSNFTKAFSFRFQYSQKILRVTFKIYGHAKSLLNSKIV